LHNQGHQVGVVNSVFRSMRDIPGLLLKTYGLKYEDANGVKTYRWHGVNVTLRIPTLSRKIWVNINLINVEKYIKENGLPDISHVHSNK